MWNAFTGPEDCPTRARAAHLHGLAQQKLGAPVVALQWYDRAIVSGESCGAYEIVAEAAGRALMVASHPLVQQDTLDHYGRMGEAALQRAGNPPHATAVFLAARGVARQRAGDLEGALADMTGALQAKETEVGPEAYEVAAYASNVGHLLKASGRTQAAAAAFSRAYELTVAARGEDSLNALSLQTSLAALDGAAGRHVEALQRLRSNLTRYEANPDAPKRARLTTLMNLAELELAHRELASAKTHYQQVVDIVAEPANDPTLYCAALSGLGAIAGEHGDDAQAERLFAKARILASEHFGTDDENYAWATMRLAIVYWQQGRGSDAVGMLRKIQATVDASSDAGLVAAYYGNLAEAQAQTGRYADAMVSARTAVAQPQPDPTTHATALFTLATIERAAGRAPEARTHGVQALKIFERVADPRQAEVQTWLDSDH